MMSALIPMRSLFNDTEMLNKEQSKLYKKILLFLFSKCQPELLLKSITNLFIPDLSNIILEYIDYNDYPNSREKISLLSGAAGTGKTHLISHIVTNLCKVYFDDIYILAPTNKALKIIRYNLEPCLNIKYQTISRFLDQGIEYSKEGKIKYKTKCYKQKENIKYVFIDEASMINKNNWEDIKKHILGKVPNVKILLIGDKYQLPPVNEQISPVFKLDLQTFNLNNILRTKNNDIIEKYDEYRQSVIKNTVIKSEENKNFRYIKDISKVIKKNFNYKKDKIISYSNHSVDKYNELVRNIIFDYPEDKFVIGEKLIFKNSIKIGNDCFYANDELIVINVGDNYCSVDDNLTLLAKDKRLSELFTQHIFSVYRLQVAMNASVNVFNVIKDDDREKFDKYFNDIFEKIKSLNLTKKEYSKTWDLFYTIKNSMDAPLNYSYALTVYKSQGSTYDKVFVDIENIKNCVKDNKTLCRSIYTAVTRGSSKIFVYEPSGNHYYEQDVKQFPYLVHYSVIKDLSLLRDKIIYTRNSYENKSKRKLVRADIVMIRQNKIVVKAGNYKWDLHIKDGSDLMIYG